MNFSQGHSGTKVRYVNRACFLRVVKTVFLENGVFVPYRKQVVLTKNGENDDLHSTYKNKGLRSSEPENRRK